MNEETHNSTIEPELEARIVALVLGEASDFETEELHRLIALRPELAAFQKEMQQVHGLMGAVASISRRALAPVVDTNNTLATTEASAFRLMETPDANWKLSADRRQSVLAVIRGEAVEDGASLADVHTGHVAFRAESPTQPLPGASAPGIEKLISAGPEGRNNLCVDPSGLGQEMSDHRWLTPPAEVVPAHSGLNPASTSLTRRLKTILSDSLSPLASSVRRRLRTTPMKIAAGICAAGFIGLMTVPSFFREESRLADSSNHWGYLEDDVAFTESFSERNSASGGTILSFQAPADASSGPEAAGGEVNEQLLTQLDSANADDAIASSKALSTLQQTLNGGGLAANEADKVASGSGVDRELFFYGLLSPGSTDDKNSPPLIAAVPPSSASEGWFEDPLEERFGNEDRAAVKLGDLSAPVASNGGVTIPQPSTSWEVKAFGGRADINAPATDSAGVQPDVFYRAPLLAGVTDMPASPEPNAAGDGVTESIPKLMIQVEEEADGKVSVDFDFALTDVDKKLEDLQASLGEQPSADNAKSDRYAGTDKSGYAADGKSDGEQLGKEPQTNEALGLSGDASDRGTMARGLSEHSDDSGVARRWAVPGQRGSGGRPESARGGRERISGNTYRSSSESPFEMKDEISEVELTVPESVMESDSKKPGENAKQVEEQAQAKNLAEGKSLDYHRGYHFHIDELDLLDGLQPLAESEAKAAAEPENDFVDDGLKDPTALIKKNAEKPTEDEFWSRRRRAEREFDADGDGIRDGVWADKEMAQSAVGLGTGDEKNSLLTDADKPQVLERNQALAQTNPEDQVESLTRLGVFSGMQGNSDSKKSSQIVAEQGRPLERANALSEKMQSLEKLKEQFGDDHPEVLKVQKGIEKELEEEVNRLGEKMREAQASEAKTVAPTRQLMQIVRPELRTRKPNLPSAGLNETSAAAEAFSTFSLHVSDVSFKLAAAALAKGEWPEASKIRIEEFVNAFDYGDPLPGKGEKVACAVEQGIHPFLQQRNVLRVSMRTSAEGRATNTPLRLTFVLDNSGSMERIDRQQTVRRAFTLLSKQLTAIDQVTLISFSRQPRLLAENVSGTESGKLVELMEQLPSEGGTNIEAALQLAFEKASAQQTPGAQNRIVLLTDGAVNLGNANPESLSQMVESMRAAGIAFDAAGISADGLNDEVLEALTRKGDGRYYLMDSGEAADDNFAQQIAGALRPSASNVKVQVEFNPKRVGQYKLLGFEKHLLKQEDFRNDAVDAAEMAAAEAGVAMYQFEAKPDGEGDVGSVSVRFRDLSTGEMVEHCWPIPYEPEAARPDQATPSLRIATTAAMLAAKLKGEALGESVDLQTLSQLIDSLPSQMQSQTRVQQLKLMIEQARQMSAK